MPVKSIPIQLDKKRNLRFDTNAVCMLEEELDISFFKIIELFGVSFDDVDVATDIVEKGPKALSPKLAINMASRIKLKNLRMLLWVGLLHEDKDLTLERVGELMDGIDSIVLIQKILEAYSAAIPVGEEVGKNP
jgi:hypothetical protein